MYSLCLLYPYSNHIISQVKAVVEGMVCAHVYEVGIDVVMLMSFKGLQDTSGVINCRGRERGRSSNFSYAPTTLF